MTETEVASKTRQRREGYLKIIGSRIEKCSLSIKNILSIVCLLLAGAILASFLCF